jgi:mono/diheme cytochrome c family protein
MRPRTAIAAIATLTIGVAYAGNFAAAATRQPDPPGKAPYEENCRKCHGVRGIAPKAMKTKFPKIATFNEEFFNKRSGDSVVTILMKGKNQDMTSFKGKLSTAQMVSVAAYIRSFDEKAKK